MKSKTVEKSIYDGMSKKEAERLAKRIKEANKAK